MGGREAKQAPALTVAVFLVLATLVASGIVSYRATAKVIANEKLVAHTLRVIAEVQTTLSLLTEAETGHRGYLLTRDPSYLAPYNQAVAELPGHLEKLEDLTADNPTQNRRVADLRQLVGERLEISKSIVDLEDKGQHASAMAVLLSARGKEKMNRVRTMVDEMMTAEDQLLEERSTDSQRSARQAITTFAAASLAALAFLLMFYLVARREVHKREEAAREIAEREAWLQTTLHSIGDAVIATDQNGKVKFLNAVAEQITGFASQEAGGRPIEDIFRIENEITRAPVENPVEKVLHSGKITGLANHTILIDRNGGEIPVEDSAAPIVDNAGKVLGVVLVFRDVTQQRRIQESARKAEKLAAAGRLAATIAHEINNPLEAVTNLLYLARTADSLAAAQNYLASADRELSRVAHITRQTLGFYRDSTVPVTIKVSALLEDVLAVYESRMRTKQITIEKDYKDEAAINTLRGELVQIFSNLIANALDALPAGGHLRLRTTPKRGGVEFEIEDNGVGIPPDNLERIFDAFFTTKTDVGTGLGLWVVKDLVEKQGGTVAVSSCSGGTDRGTRFIVFIPSMDKESVSRMQKVS
ncbi:MAG TPA: CHASE3 domain-containing protein [Candidatus Angelobacter sp.]